jgi:hypothetical protein
MHTGNYGDWMQYYRIHPVIDQITASWSEPQKNVIHKLINKYGLPNETSSRRLIWHHNGPWKRTIVYLDTVPHNFPTPHLDFLKQTIDYKVPVELFDTVAQFDGSVYPDRTSGEASAKCDKEEMNFLALNMLNDIVIGKRTVEEAKRFFAETAIKFHQGISSPYIEKFLFPKQTHTADPDVRYF